jgi:phage gp29-like protein
MINSVQDPTSTVTGSPSAAGLPRQNAATAGGGKSAAELVRQSNRWRDNYNPIRGLVIARAIGILEAADRGDFAELQLVMRKVERRYSVLKGLKARRLAALEKLDWEIKVVNDLPEGATRADAEAQQKFLRSRYELIENLTETIGFLVTAEFRGYALLQKHRFNDGGRFDGAVREFHWLPQDQFSRNGQFGDFFYNQNSNFGIGLDACATLLGEQNRIGGAQLPRADFLIREVDSPIYEIALVAFVNWCMGRKDWAAFTEIFGLPNGVAIMPGNIPPGMEDEYRAAAERVADGVSGALPNGSDIKFPTAGVRGEAPFKHFCEAQDADVVLAGTGGRLAMLSADHGGLGNGPALEHAAAFDEIALADARKINATLQKDFDRLELATEFPGQPVLAYFELCAQDATDVGQVVANVAALAAAGFAVDAAWLSEVTGIQFAVKEDAGAVAIRQGGVA